MSFTVYVIMGWALTCNMFTNCLAYFKDYILKTSLKAQGWAWQPHSVSLINMEEGFGLKGRREMALLSTSVSQIFRARINPTSMSRKGNLMLSIREKKIEIGCKKILWKWKTKLLKFSWWKTTSTMPR